MTQTQDDRLQALLDREEIFDLVRRERFCRDQQRFDEMSACFHPDAYVRTSWYDGHGGQAYVDATRKGMQSRSNSKHWIFPAVSQINGDRALVESPAMIFNRVMLEDVEIDFFVFCRFFSRVVREDGTWKILTFEVLFERDVLTPVDTTQTPPLDREVLDALRPSYKHLAYLQQRRGFIVNPDLLGDDRRDELAAFHAGEREWVMQAA